MQPAPMCTCQCAADQSGDETDQHAPAQGHATVSGLAHDAARAWLCVGGRLWRQICIVLLPVAYACGTDVLARQAVWCACGEAAGLASARTSTLAVLSGDWCCRRLLAGFAQPTGAYSLCNFRTLASVLLQNRTFCGKKIGRVRWIDQQYLDLFFFFSID